MPPRNSVFSRTRVERPSFAPVTAADEAAGAGAQDEQVDLLIPVVRGVYIEDDVIVCRRHDTTVP